MNDPPMTLLDIRSLDHPVIHAANLQVDAGERICLTAPSGAGKSVFLQCLADLLPHSGEVFFDGQPRTQFAGHAWRQQVCYVASESAWWSGRVIDHFPARVTLPLSTLQLDNELLERSPSGLSSGQRQRLSLLRALARHPRVLMLDEPTANLDERNTDAVETLLQEWTGEGNALIFTSHNVQQQMRLATRRWAIRDGRVEAQE